MIILNEREFAERAIEAHDLGAKPVETMSCVAKYYRSLGYKTSEVKRQVEDFLSKSDPIANLVKWRDTISSVVKSSSKSALVEIESVGVSSEEINICKSIKGNQMQRLMFTLICLAKFSRAASRMDTCWVNQKDKEIFKMANVVTSITRQSLMLNDLMQRGLIKFAKKIDNVNIEVVCLCGDDVAVSVSDFRNVGNQYMKFLGEPYFECSCCGLTVKKMSNSQKYCRECAADVNRSKSLSKYWENEGCTARPQDDVDLHIDCIEKYGVRYSRLYNIWNGIKERCLNENNRDYNTYGGRGITICAEWKDDFEKFARWSMENGYREDLSLGRINNNKGYRPSNCRWTDHKTLINNRSNTVFFTIGDETKSLTDWCNQYGAKRDIVYARVKNLGWDPIDALTTPIVQKDNS